MAHNPSIESPDLIHIELDLDPAHESEFREMLSELLSGNRRRSMTIAEQTDDITARAMQAFDFLLEAVTLDITTGRAPGQRQTVRLVRFLAALYEPAKFRLDLGDLRAMDADLAGACIDCLNYYRLALKDISQLRPDARETVYALFKNNGLLEA